MNFFAIVGRRGAEEVKLIDLNQQAQNELTERLEPHLIEILGGDHVPFAPGYQAGDREILTIGHYELPATLAVLIDAGGAANLRTLDAADIESAHVRSIVAVEWSANNRARVAFQRVEQRYLLKAEGFRLMVAAGRFVRDNRPGIEVEDRIDAIAHRGTLYIASWSRTHAVLDLSAYLREATVTEARIFLRHRRLSVDDDFDLEHLTDSVVRRKIAAITESRILERATPQALRRCAARAGVALNVAQGRIVLPSDKKDFKAVLAFLNQDYVVFEATEEYWLTNSKRPIGR